MISLKTICLATTALALMLTGPASAADTWIRAESENFVIYSDNNPAKTREYAGKLEAFRYIIDVFYNEMGDSQMGVSQKAVFNYVDNVDSSQMVFSNLKSGAFRPIATCRDGEQYFSTAEGQMNNTGNDDRLLDKALDLNVAYMFYAYNAAYMKTRFSKPLPRWVRIGLGWYFMTAVIGADGKVSLGRPAPRISVAYNALDDAVDLSSKWAYIPYADLIAEKPLTDKENDAEVLESWVMVSHLMSDKARSKKFFEYLHLVMEGTESMEAYNKAIGIDPESYRAVLKQYKTKGVPTQVYEFKGLPDSATTISPLPYKEPVPLLDAGTRACPPDKHARTLLSRLQKVAPKYPDGVLAQQALARATIKAGNPEDAKAWLTAQVTRQPDDFDSQLLLGQMYLALAERGPADARAANYVSARQALVKAYQLNPGSPPALYYYARSNADRPDYPNDNILKAAELAEDYSGGSYTVFLSDLLIRRGDYDRARTLIDDWLAEIPADNPKKKASLQAIRDAIAARKPSAELTVMLNTFEREFEHKDG